MSYPGSKTGAGVAHRIIGQMEPHSVYVETCAGEAAIFEQKAPAQFSLLIDKNPNVIQALNARHGDKAGVKAVVGDVLKWLPEISAWLPPDAVVYVDPPYLLETRQGRLYYDHEPEVEDPDWHKKLLAVLLAMKCRVLLSGYPSKLYSSQLRQWRCIEYPVMTRGGKKRECLWCNFDEPGELHDWRYAGFNFRQRFGMKRFVDRWLARIDTMPERRAGYIRHELEKRLQAHHGRRGRPENETPPMVLAAVNNLSRLESPQGRR